MAADTVNHQDLAKDIQTNADSAIADPTNKEALAALQKDAQLLQGPLQGTISGDNQALQNTIQKDLDTLESQGNLPRVTIAENGSLTVDTRIKDYRDINGYVNDNPLVRSLYIDPQKSAYLIDNDPLQPDPTLPMISLNGKDGGRPNQTLQ